METPRVTRGAVLAREGVRSAALVGLVLLGLLLPPPAHAGILCTVFKYCRYEGVPFSITVVDTETGAPLPEVHALAEWVQAGLFGSGGPVMVQDAVSGPDGVLAFPAWGPLRGSPDGLLVHEAPVITLFKPGYVLVPPSGRARAIWSSPPDGTADTTRVWHPNQAGQTFRMERFQGTTEEWVKELRDDPTSYASVGLSDKRPLLNRLRRVWVEREKCPARYQEPGEFFWHIEREIKHLEGEGR